MQAIDLSGAWASRADLCNQVFVRKGRAKEVGFAALSEQHGGGFIVEANQLRGKRIGVNRFGAAFGGQHEAAIQYLERSLQSAEKTQALYTLYLAPCSLGNP